MNSEFRYSSRKSARFGASTVFMHPDDIATAGLSEGQKVTIQSAHGSLQTEVTKDPSMRPGVVSMTHVWGFSGKNDHTGSLVSIEKNHLSTISFMPQQSAIPVNILAANQG